MDLTQTSITGGESTEKENEVVVNNYSSMVDPFLVEAIQDRRHRLTILRMELDIQKFLQNHDQLQFEFQRFPSSYLRLAAHRVAQHYCLQTMALDNLVDGPGTKIVVRKTTESKYPSICLSEIPAKHLEHSKHEKVKIAIRPRPCRTSSCGGDVGIKRSTSLSVEERKEEYDRARARIFSSPTSPSSDETFSQVLANGKGLFPSKDENGGCPNFTSNSEKTSGVGDVGTSSRVAIFRDREKDRTDPDYDRSYERYVRSFPTNHGVLASFSMPRFQPPFVHYEAGYPQMGQIPRTQASLNYGPSSDPNTSHYSATGLNQASRDGIYMQWPSPAIMYAHSYEQFRHSVFQAPFCQQPLSFDYSQNH